MVDTSNKLEPNVDETEQIFYQYRQGINEALDKVRTKLIDQAKQEASNIIEKANSESTNIIGAAHQKVDAILALANSKAEKIIQDAEEKVRTEAKNKVKKQEERLISEAKTESSRIIAEARKTAQETADKVLSNAKKEADALIKRLTEDSKKEADILVKNASDIKNQAEIEANLVKKKAQEETRYAITTAQEEARRNEEKKCAEVIEKAHQEAEEIVNSARNQAMKEREKLIAEYVEEATKLAEFEKIKMLSQTKSKSEYIVREIKNRLKSELEKSSLLIDGAKERLTGIMTEMSNQIGNEQFDIDTSLLVAIPVEEISADFTKEVQEKMLFANDKDEEKNYKGRLELTILAPIDAKQKKDFEKLLTEIADLHLMGDGGSSDGSNWLEVELNQPIPLVSMIKQMPPVKNVTSHGNNIVVALKPR